MQKEDLESIFYALFDAKFNNKTTLSEATGKSKPNLKTFSAAIPVD